jgi:hypothetical protein
VLFKGLHACIAREGSKRGQGERGQEERGQGERGHAGRDGGQG